jgi:hypothetical protein
VGRRNGRLTPDPPTYMSSTWMLSVVAEQSRC